MVEPKALIIEGVPNEVTRIVDAKPVLNGAAQGLFHRIIAHTIWTVRGVLAQLDERLITVYVGPSWGGRVSLLALVHGQISRDGRTAAVVSVAVNDGWGCLPNLLAHIDRAIKQDNDGVIEEIILWSPDSTPELEGYEQSTFSGMPALVRYLPRGTSGRAA